MVRFFPPGVCGHPREEFPWIGRGESANIFAGSGLPLGDILHTHIYPHQHSAHRMGSHCYQFPGRFPSHDDPKNHIRTTRSSVASTSILRRTSLLKYGFGHRNFRIFFFCHGCFEDLFVAHTFRGVLRTCLWKSVEHFRKPDRTDKSS